eukprot:jgi/Botrbrau1/19308/Bobra.0073s0047.1
MIQCITGQLIYKRALSRRLVFFDLEVHSKCAESHTVELILKAGEGLTQEEVRDLRDTLKLGDVATAWGHMGRTCSELLVHRISIVSRWKDTHPREAFRPRQAHKPAAAAPSHISHGSHMGGVNRIPPAPSSEPCQQVLAESLSAAAENARWNLSGRQDASQSCHGFETIPMGALLLGPSVPHEASDRRIVDQRLSSHGAHMGRGNDHMGTDGLGQVAVPSSQTTIKASSWQLWLPQRGQAGDACAGPQAAEPIQEPDWGALTQSSGSHGAHVTDSTAGRVSNALGARTSSSPQGVTMEAPPCAVSRMLPEEESLTCGTHVSQLPLAMTQQERGQGGEPAGRSGFAFERSGSGGGNPCLMSDLGDASGAVAGTSGSQMCKYWINTGKCHKGAVCRYAHPPESEDGAVRLAWVASRKQARRQAAAAGGDPHAASAASKRHRARIFADWIVSTFGLDFLRSGSGVVDVAGGRGELAFYLQNVHGIHTTVVDPRPGKLSRKQHRILASSSLQPADSAHCSAGSLPLRTPTDESWPASLDPALRATGGFQAAAHNFQVGRADDQGKVCDRSLSRIAEGPATGEDRFVVGGNGWEGQLPEHLEAEFGMQLWESRHGEALRRCSIVVGLHPDQATDPILEFALAFGKPFAIIPCCVFARQFPHRRLRIPPLQSGVPPPDSVPASLPSALPSTPTETGVQVEVRPSGTGQAQMPSGGASNTWGTDRDYASNVLKIELADGETAVESHAQLVVYLRERGGSEARIHYLPFEGLNQVVFRPPPPRHFNLIP